MRDVLIILLVCVMMCGLGSCGKSTRAEGCQRSLLRRISGAVITELGAAGLLFLLIRGEAAS